MSMIEQQIKIVAQPGTEPDICRFTADRPLSSNRSIDCRDKSSAQGAPLLEGLFAIDGIREVMVSGNTVTVAKSTSEPWPVLGKKIGAAIRAVLESGVEPIPSAWQKAVPSENHIFEQIEKLFRERVNPGISAHGGQVELVRVEGTKVYLRLSGGCQGCGAANATLKGGIEKAIKALIPEVTEIVDVTDHASGKNPYIKKK